MSPVPDSDPYAVSVGTTLDPDSDRVRISDSAAASPMLESEGESATPSASSTQQGIQRNARGRAHASPLSLVADNPSPSSLSDRPVSTQSSSSHVSEAHIPAYGSKTRISDISGVKSLAKCSVVRIPQRHRAVIEELCVCKSSPCLSPPTLSLPPPLNREPPLTKSYSFHLRAHINPTASQVLHLSRILDAVYAVNTNQTEPAIILIIAYNTHVPCFDDPYVLDRTGVDATVRHAAVALRCSV